MRESQTDKSRRQLTIAIDFDGTFAEDPETFREIMSVCW